LRTLVLVTLLSGCAITPRSQQQERVRSLMPATVERPATGQVTSLVLRVRARVAEDYQSQVMRPDETISSQFARLNEYTEPAMGVRFELVEVRPWSHRSGQALVDSLSALEAADPADDVDLVMGWVSGLTIVELSLDKLGVARLGGRHAVMRAIDDRAEAEAFKAAFTALDLEERETLSRARRRHKELTLLIHEWAHTLGAPHDGHQSGCLFPMYTEQQAGFHPETLRVLTTLAEVQYQRPTPARAAARIRDALDAAPSDLFITSELAPWRASLDAVARNASAVRAPSHSLGPAGAGLDDVRRALRAGELARARELLAPLLPSGEPMALELSCVLELQTNPGAALPACRRASELPNASGEAFLRLAGAAFAAKDSETGRPALLRAFRAFTEAPATPPDAWLRLAQVAHSGSCVTVVEQAAPRLSSASDTTFFSSWARTTRRWVGLSATTTSKSAPCEGPFVETFRLAETAVRERRFTPVAQAVARLREDAPTAGGPAVLECERAFMQGQLALAQIRCGAALTTDPELTLAHYVLGLVHEVLSEWPRAIKRYVRVLELDDSIRDVWSRLAAAYTRTRNTAASKALAERYQARFGEPLR
jgi:tetratricopeptide (TPR) repeat protein